MSKDRKKELDKKAEEGRAIATKIKHAKERAYELEKKNKAYVVAFFSGPGWYKIGGNSALIYAYLLAPRLELDVRVRPDRDLYFKFKDGVVSVRSIKDLAEKFEKIGIKITKQDDELVVFKLKQKLTDAEFKSICSVREQRVKQINQIVKVKVVYPSIAAKQREIAGFLRSRLHHASAPDRDLILTKMTAVALEMCADLTQVASGQIGAEVCLKSIQKKNNRFMAWGTVLMDQGIFTVEDTLRVEQLLLDANTLIDKEIKKLVK